MIWDAHSVVFSSHLSLKRRGLTDFGESDDGYIVGANGRAVVSSETRRKISDAAKKTWELRKDIVEFRNGAVNGPVKLEESPEDAKKVRRRPMSDATNEKIRIATTGRRLSTERKKKISSKNRQSTLL